MRKTKIVTLYTSRYYIFIYVYYVPSMYTMCVYNITFGTFPPSPCCLQLQNIDAIKSRQDSCCLQMFHALCTKDLWKHTWCWNDSGSLFMQQRHSWNRHPHSWWWSFRAISAQIQPGHTKRVGEKKKKKKEKKKKGGRSFYKYL